MKNLYLIYTLLYIPQIAYENIKDDKSLLNCSLTFLRNFVFVGSYTQLWYYVGLMVATLLLYLFVKKLKLSDKKVVAISLILYAMGTVVNAYIQPLRKSIDVMRGFGAVDKRYLILWLYDLVFDTTRNGIFFGLPYVSFGYLIAKNREKIIRKNYIMPFFLSFVAMTGEAFIVHRVFGASGQDMLFMLLPTSIFIFLFVLFIDCKASKRNVSMARNTRYISSLCFNLHLFISFYYGEILTNVFHVELNYLIRFAAVTIQNFIAAVAIVAISNTRSSKWMKKLY